MFSLVPKTRASFLSLSLHYPFHAEIKYRWKLQNLRFHAIFVVFLKASIELYVPFFFLCKPLNFCSFCSCWLFFFSSFFFLVLCSCYFSYVDQKRAIADCETFMLSSLTWRRSGKQYTYLIIVKKPASKNLLFWTMAKYVIVFWGTYWQFRRIRLLIRLLISLTKLITEFTYSLVPYVLVILKFTIS